LPKRSSPSRATSLLEGEAGQAGRRAGAAHLGGGAPATRGVRCPWCPRCPSLEGTEPEGRQTRPGRGARTRGPGPSSGATHPRPSVPRTAGEDTTARDRLWFGGAVPKAASTCSQTR
jgi:hypothetical protein